MAAITALAMLVAASARQAEKLGQSLKSIMLSEPSSAWMHSPP